LEGKFLFLETFLGQVVNLHYVEAEAAIEVGNQFIKDLEGWAEDSTEKPTEASWVTPDPSKAEINKGPQTGPAYRAALSGLAQSFPLIFQRSSSSSVESLAVFSPPSP